MTEVANRTEWRVIPGTSGKYEASSSGEIRSLDWEIISSTGQRYPHKGKVLQQSVDHSTGYLRVAISLNGNPRRRTVHSLVAEAFLGPRPDGMEVCHCDGVRTNNAASNLRYDTPSENHKDRNRHGTMWQTNRTHCPSGHEYTKENVYLYDGRRYCRTCRSGKRKNADRNTKD
ncbi:NUMOD4 motif-containing HNH endonuclease [Corynebacterium kalidii]